MNKPAPNADRTPSHLAAVLFALLITMLWSSSWVLIKRGLNPALPALTFAGLRYTLAWIFIGEALTLKQIAGLLLAIIGVILVQLRWNRNAGQAPAHTTDDAACASQNL